MEMPRLVKEHEAKEIDAAVRFRPFKEVTLLLLSLLKP
jgi:hypothetical protein